MFGFIKKSLYTIKIDRIRIKQLAALKLKSNTVLDKKQVEKNIFDNGFFIQDEFYYRFKKNIAEVILLEDMDVEKITEFLKTIKKDKFFISAIIIKLSFVDSINKNDIETLKNNINSTPYKNDMDIRIFNGVLASDNVLFINSKIFTSYVSTRMSIFHTSGMINSICNSIKIKKIKNFKDKFENDKKIYKLSTFNSVLQSLFICSFLGVIIIITGLIVILFNQFDEGAGLLAAGSVSYLSFWLPWLFLKRKAIISKDIIIEKKGFSKPFILNVDKVKWHIRGVFTGRGMGSAIVVFSDYIFDENELATYQNCYGNYIIIKNSDYNKRILNKFVGGETKI